MGRLVAVEGLDGSGKRTLVGRVIADLEADRRSVTTLAFPRYGASIHAELAAEALRGEHGDLAGSPRRWRCCSPSTAPAPPRICAARSQPTTSSCSTATSHPTPPTAPPARTSTRTVRSRPGSAGSSSTGSHSPRPICRCSSTSRSRLAAERARRRGEADASRKLDAYERDGDLQQRTAAVYRELAIGRWRGEWWSVTPGSAGPDSDPALLSKRMAQWLRKNRMGQH